MSAVDYAPGEGGVIEQLRGLGFRQAMDRLGEKASPKFNGGHYRDGISFRGLLGYSWVLRNIISEANIRTVAISANPLVLPGEREMDYSLVIELVGDRNDRGQKRGTASGTWIFYADGEVMKVIKIPVKNLKPDDQLFNQPENGWVSIIDSEAMEQRNINANAAIIETGLDNTSLNLDKLRNIKPA